MPKQSDFIVRLFDPETRTEKERFTVKRSSIVSIGLMAGHLVCVVKHTARSKQFTSMDSGYMLVSYENGLYLYTLSKTEALFRRMLQINRTHFVKLCWTAPDRVNSIEGIRISFEYKADGTAIEPLQFTHNGRIIPTEGRELTPDDVLTQPD